MTRSYLTGLLAVAAFSTVLLASLAAARTPTQSVVAAAAPSKAAERAWTIGRWTRIGRADPSGSVRVVVGVAHNTTDLAATCIAVSDPKSATYGQYLTLEEVAARVAVPASEAAVLSWLQSEPGVESVATVATRDYLVAHMSVATAERLFRVRLDVFRHPEDAETLHVASLTHYSLPRHVAPHVALVLGISEVPPHWVDADAHHVKEHTHHQQAFVGADSATPLPVMAPSIAILLAADSTLWLVVNQPCWNATHGEYPCSGGANANPIMSYEVHAALNCSSAHVVAGNLSAANALVNSTFGTIVLLKYTQGIEANQFYNVSIRAIPQYGAPSDWAALSFNWTSLPKTYRGMVTSPTMSPSYTRKYYGTTGNDNAGSKGASQAVVEFYDQFYTPSDVTKYLSTYNIKSKANVTLVGPNTASDPGIEAQMDIELLLGMVPNVDITFWSVKLTNASTIFPNFMLEWALQMNNASSVPLVNSISYGLPESMVNVTYLERSNTEFIKLCMRGISVIVCSQDAGATGNGHNTNSCELTPIFPAVSPWVTSVGSTVQLLEAQPRANGMIGEGAVSVMTGLLWTSGGGFAASPANRRPAYQDNAVNAYLKSKVQFPPAQTWNTTGRAYPDVAAIGTNYDMVIQGMALPLGDGTSSSTPIFSSIISLLNNDRLSAGKPALGFLNPMLYHFAEYQPELFYDVTVGSNECGQLVCCPYGYQCTTGYDAVTGLGTVGDFEKLQATIMNM